MMRTEPLRVSQPDRKVCWGIYRDKSGATDLNEYYFDKLIEDAAARKREIAQLLHMPADGRLFTRLEPTEEDLVNTPEYATLDRVWRIDPYLRVEYVMTGLLQLPGERRKMRLQKAVQRQLKNRGDTQDHEYERYAKAIDAALLAASNLKPRWGIVSANPVDALLASELAPGWGDEADHASCFRVRGWYANATIQMARSRKILIAYTVQMTDRERETGIMDAYRNPPWFRNKVSRVWLHLPSNHDPEWGDVHQTIWLARNYGDMSRAHAGQIAQLLAERLDWAQNREPIGWAATPYAPARISGAIYSDSSTTCAMVRPGRYVGAVSNVARAMCLSCGELHRDKYGPDSYSMNQVCASCGDDEERYECVACGVLVDEGSEYCSDCGDFCRQCGNEYGHDDLYPAQGTNVCASCRDRLYTCCDDCEEYYQTTRVTSIEVDASVYRQSVCENCIDGYTQCEGINCDTYLDDTSETMCESCRKTERCEDCLTPMLPEDYETDPKCGPCRRSFETANGNQLSIPISETPAQSDESAPVWAGRTQE